MATRALYKARMLHLKKRFLQQCPMIKVTYLNLNDWSYKRYSFIALISYDILILSASSKLASGVHSQTVVSLASEYIGVYIIYEYIIIYYNIL